MSFGQIFVSGIEIFICLPGTNWKPIESKEKKERERGLTERGERERKERHRNERKR